MVTSKEVVARAADLGARREGALAKVAARAGIACGGHATLFVEGGGKYEARTALG